VKVWSRKLAYAENTGASDVRMGSSCSSTRQLREGRRASTGDPSSSFGAAVHRHAPQGIFNRDACIGCENYVFPLMRYLSLTFAPLRIAPHISRASDACERVQENKLPDSSELVRNRQLSEVVRTCPNLEIIRVEIVPERRARKRISMVSLDC
jgi:hypothetical protein